MVDFVLEISFDAADTALADTVDALLFLSASRGSTSQEQDGTQTVCAYFASAEARREAQQALDELPVRVRTVDPKSIDWLERYEQSLKAIEIGGRFVVAPDASLLPGDGSRLQIVVPQEQAFGTGSHETTALCMELLETAQVAGGRGLDVGAGSGILAIAMIRLGARKVVAFDNDPDAYGALRDNRLRNSVSQDSLAIFIGGVDALRSGIFDVLTMNIIPEVIMPLLPQVSERMSSSGRLIVSGVLTERRDDVVRAADTERLQLVREARTGEWWAGVFQRAR